MTDHDTPADRVTGGRTDAAPAAASRTVARRVGAFLVDVVGIQLIITSMVLMAVSLGVDLLTADEPRARPIRRGLSLLGTALVLGYFVVMEAMSGRTVGKRLLGLRVVSPDGSPISWRAATVRRLPFVIGNLLPGPAGAVLIVALPALALLTVVSDTTGGRGYHDRWAGTQVVRDDLHTAPPGPM